MTNPAANTYDLASVRFPLGDFLAMSLARGEPGSCTATVPVDARCLNPHGNVHGGVLFTMVDTAMGGIDHERVALWATLCLHRGGNALPAVSHEWDAGGLTLDLGHVESSRCWRKRDDQDHGQEELLR